MRNHTSMAWLEGLPFSSSWIDMLSYAHITIACSQKQDIREEVKQMNLLFPKDNTY